MFYIVLIAIALLKICMKITNLCKEKYKIYQEFKQLFQKNSLTILMRA